MGQVYSVYGKFKFRDNNPAEFCKTIRNTIKDRKYSVRKHNMYDPFECFKALTADDAYKGTIRSNGIKDEDEWAAHFDGSYGRATVLEDIFYEALYTLEDGSYIQVCPDDYYFILRKEDGIVKIEYVEE